MPQYKRYWIVYDQLQWMSLCIFRPNTSCTWRFVTGRWRFHYTFPIFPDLPRFWDSSKQSRRHRSCQLTSRNLLRPTKALSRLRYDFSRPLITSFMEPTWGPPGAARTQDGPMLATRPLLSGTTYDFQLTSETIELWGGIVWPALEHYIDIVPHRHFRSKYSQYTLQNWCKMALRCVVMISTLGVIVGKILHSYQAWPQNRGRRYTTLIQKFLKPLFT